MYKKIYSADIPKKVSKIIAKLERSYVKPKRSKFSTEGEYLRALADRSDLILEEATRTYNERKTSHQEANEKRRMLNMTNQHKSISKSTKTDETYEKEYIKGHLRLLRYKMVETGRVLDVLKKASVQCDEYVVMSQERESTIQDIIVQLENDMRNISDIVTKLKEDDDKSFVYEGIGLMNYDDSYHGTSFTTRKFFKIEEKIRKNVSDIWQRYFVQHQDQNEDQIEDQNIETLEMSEIGMLLQTKISEYELKEKKYNDIIVLYENAKHDDADKYYYKLVRCFEYIEECVESGEFYDWIEFYTEKFGIDDMYLCDDTVVFVLAFILKGIQYNEFVPNATSEKNFLKTMYKKYNGDITKYRGDSNSIGPS